MSLQNENTEQKETLQSLQWGNCMVLNQQTVQALYQRIHQYLSFKEHGFGVLEETVYRHFVQQNSGVFRTVSGLPLNDERILKYSMDLVQQIRSHKMIHHQRNKHQNTRRQIAKIFRIHTFSQSFHLRDGWNDTKEFTKQHVTQWITECNKKEVPPYMLLVEWLKRYRLFHKNKQITQYIRNYTKESEDSFHWFCRVIAESDESSFFHEDLKRKKAEHLEQIGFHKIQQSLKENGIHVEMYSEEQQKQMKVFVNGIIRFTPDILFGKEGVVINGKRIYWMDMKNYFVTPRDGLLWEKMNTTCKKYANAFGNGAILCKGFQSEVKLPYCTLLLDAFVIDTPLECGGDSDWKNLRTNTSKFMEEHNPPPSVKRSKRKWKKKNTSLEDGKDSENKKRRIDT